MVKCPKCGKQNSPNDDFCEKCGHRLKEKNKNSVNVWKVIGTILAIFLLLKGCSSLGLFGSETNEYKPSLEKETRQEIQQVTCNKPYILAGTSCCLDQNDNSICDNKETPECNPNWQCSSWSDCSQQGIQKRTCTDKNNCGVSTNKPTESQTCEKLYSMNQNVQVDYLTYTVTKAQTFTEMGTSMFNKETEGKFVKVYLTILNNDKQTQQIFTPRFTIEDNQGRLYDRLSDDMIYIADYIELGKSLQPGLKASGAIVFEMPKDSTNLRLIIKGDWLSTSQVKIALSNIQNIDKDTTQQEEQDKMWDEAMAESKAKTEELMNQCNSPFVCTSSCPQYLDVGQKNCPSGQLCCMQ